MNEESDAKRDTCVPHNRPGGRRPSQGSPVGPADPSAQAWLRECARREVQDEILKEEPTNPTIVIYKLRHQLKRKKNSCQ